MIYDCPNCNNTGLCHGDSDSSWYCGCPHGQAKKAEDINRMEAMK